MVKMVKWVKPMCFTCPVFPLFGVMNRWRMKRGRNVAEKLFLIKEGLK